MASETITATEESMKKALGALSREFATIRTGRASASSLDSIKVDYYGTLTPITQIAGVKTPEAHMLIVEPWDKTALKSIEKAILGSDLGITPSNDGSVIRLPFPAPTEERRRELVKQCHRIAEESRVSMRNIRRDGNTKLDHAKKDDDLSEDDVRRDEVQIQKLTDSYITKIDELLKKKEVEVMEI
jgi:ribosome recycling factor